VRQPSEIEVLYLDFDGFFASVEQQVDKNLRGRPVGIVPFDGTTRTCVIACSREAKRYGVKNVMNVLDAKKLCPDIVLVPQKPDLYRRAHNALISEIAAINPVDAIKSIDELTCKVQLSDRGDPETLAAKIKRRITDNIGRSITCSIGFAANRQLAKMACKAGKGSEDRYGDGLTIWHPADMSEPLLCLTLEDIPGVGSRMLRRPHHHHPAIAQHRAETDAPALGQCHRRAPVVRAARLCHPDTVLWPCSVRPWARLAVRRTKARPCTRNVAPADHQGCPPDAARRVVCGYAVAIPGDQGRQRAQIGDIAQRP
jgi:nucleotidyltransferase/DNA polymerase involved in DNA repair